MKTTSSIRNPAIAFTLLELLTVIAIIGILAAIAVPTLHTFQPNPLAVTGRQLLDDIGRARQLAISQRTTVFMVFVPPAFWNNPAYATLPPTEKVKADKLWDKQYIGYNFVSLRGVGEQPGVSNPRYWSSWRTLPKGAIIAPEKFGPRNTINYKFYTNNATGIPVLIYNIPGFSTNAVPFPSEFVNPAQYALLPSIGFNSFGQLISQTNEVIPIIKGTVMVPRAQPSGLPTNNAAATIAQTAAGNVTNVVVIDWLTGRARIEKQELR